MPEHLNAEPHFGIPGKRYRHPYMPGDAFYEQLMHAHRGLGDAQSELLNARLLLLLANHIGDLRVLGEAIELARAGVVAKDEAARTGVAQNAAP
jgi:hypothetical protein